MERLRFRSFGSGSSGNCYFIGNASYGILIDAGIGVRSIRKFLKSMGLDFQNIWGVFVTHDHADHIKAVGQIGEKYFVPIYTTREIHNGINKNYCITQKLSTSQRFIEIGKRISVGEFNVTAFPVSHDSTASVGFSVDYRGKVFSIATDLGVVDEIVQRYLVESDYMILEANYDEIMLENGPYPLILQERIKANTGHLSNVQAAEFLVNNYTERWKYVYLCHLSKDNNTPELAYSVVYENFQNQLIDFEKNTQIIALPRKEASKMYIFE